MTKHENESKTSWEAGGPTEKVRVVTKEACVFSQTDVFVSCMNNRSITYGKARKTSRGRQKQARDSDRSEREFARL